MDNSNIVTTMMTTTTTTLIVIIIVIMIIMFINIIIITNTSCHNILGFLYTRVNVTYKLPLYKNVPILPLDCPHPTHVNRFATVSPEVVNKIIILNMNMARSLSRKY